MKEVPWRTLWFYGMVLVCVALVRTTVLGIEQFNLRMEGNLAAMWSGLLLLLAALHAYDGTAENRGREPAVARAWLVISLVLLSLSVDEIASLHERLPAETHLMYWGWVFPFAAAYALLAVYALVVLYRSGTHRRPAVLMGVAFLLFGSVAVQEEIEWRFDFPRRWRPLRGAVEEGTELLAMLLLIKATMANTKGVLSREGRSPFPTLEAVRAWRVPLLVTGAVAAPLVAWITVRIPPSTYGHGEPAHWPATALFFMAAIAALRPALSGAPGLPWTRWALAVACLVGSAAMTISVRNPVLGPLMVSLAALVIVLWGLDSRYDRRRYGPAAVLVVGGIAMTWALSHSAFALFWLPQWIALAVYSVHSAGPGEPARAA